MKNTLAHLKAAVKKSGRNIEIEETPPHEMDNEGVIAVYLDQGKGEQFVATNCCSICNPYYDDVKGDRSDAIQYLIDDITSGFEPMSEDTAFAAGIDLPT
tara:strand:+ start:10622 stop:10921 length:300 start_codon:yes stop_codon:yes gene_type:complete